MPTRYNGPSPQNAGDHSFLQPRVESLQTLPDIPYAMSANRRQAYRYGVAETDATALLRISEGEVKVRVVDASAGGFGVTSDRELVVHEGEIAGLTSSSGQSICRVTWVEYEAGGTSVGLQRISEIAEEPSAHANMGLLTRWLGRSSGSVLLLLAFGAGLGLVMGLAKFGSLPFFGKPGTQRTLRAEIPQAASERAAALTRHFNELDNLKSRQFVKKLQLTDGQQRKIDGIVEKLVFDLATVHLDREGRSPEMSSHMGLMMIRRAWVQVEDSLTPEQITRWDAMLDSNPAPTSTVQQAGM